MEARFVTINGKSFTKKEYDAFKKASSPKKPHKKAKRQKTYNEYKEVAPYIEGLMKGIKTCKSLAAYKRNGYRQWGNNCKLVLNMKEIKEPFNEFCDAFHAMDEAFDDVKRESKMGTKATFQYLQIFAWKVADLGVALKTLYDGIAKSNILASPMANEEMICGEGRRLGLKTLVSRSFTTCANMDTLLKEAQVMCDSH